MNGHEAGLHRTNRDQLRNRVEPVQTIRIKLKTNLILKFKVITSVIH